MYISTIIDENDAIEIKYSYHRFVNFYHETDLRIQILITIFNIT